MLFVTEILVSVYGMICQQTVGAFNFVFLGARGDATHVASGSVNVY